MDFRYKCALQHLFSALPKGEEFNYLFQKRITKTVPFSGVKFLKQIEKAEHHHRNFEQFYELGNRDPKYYEFGAGWDLIIPLYFSRLNFEASVIDIKKLVKLELINDTLQKLNRHVFPEAGPKPKITNLKELQEQHGLRYYAPMDARKTSFAENSFDFATSTSTMEHIPPPDILPILQETHRILKKGGVFSLIINYKDHWSHFDGNISIYNFLQYSPKAWRKYNPAIHYQNRLRHSDYLKIIEQSDFQKVKEQAFLPDEKEREALGKLQLAEEFQHYAMEDLGIRGSEIVLKKA